MASLSATEVAGYGRRARGYGVNAAASGTAVPPLHNTICRSARHRLPRVAYTRIHPFRPTRARFVGGRWSVVRIWYTVRWTCGLTAQARARQVQLRIARDPTYVRGLWGASAERGNDGTSPLAFGPAVVRLRHRWSCAYSSPASSIAASAPISASSEFGVRTQYSF
jgi:hypothetical protein